METRKEIKILFDFEKSGLKFTKEEKYIVKILHIGIEGGFDRYGCDGTMEGSLNPCVVVEFENGKIMAFDIDYHIHIVGNAE